MFSIKIDAKDMTHNFKMIKKRVGKRKYLNRIGVVVRNWMKRNFIDKGTENKWVPMAASTKANKREQSTGRSLLRAEGDMRNSINRSISGDTAIIGFTDWKAPLHHKGTGTHIGKERYLITPSKSALRFVTEKGVQYNKHFILHPGVPSRPLLPSDALANKMGTETLEEYTHKVMLKEVL